MRRDMCTWAWGWDTNQDSDKYCRWGTDIPQVLQKRFRTIDEHGGRHHTRTIKTRSFIENGLGHAEMCLCSFEYIEGEDNVNSEVSAFQWEEAGRLSRTLVSGRIWWYDCAYAEGLWQVKVYQLYFTLGRIISPLLVGNPSLPNDFQRCC